jgi:hypothetical protein
MRLFSNRSFVILLLCGIVFFFETAPSAAQPKETPDSVRFGALRCLYRSILTVNKRNMRLQGMQKEFEDMQPLAPQNLDSAHLAENLAKVRKDLLILNDQRHELTKNLRVYADTLRNFEALMVKEDEKKAVENFLSAYQLESAAFTGYSQRLSLMLTVVRQSLIFLQTVPMEHKGNDIVFATDTSATIKYLDFQGQISQDQMEVDKAIERSIKLTAKENVAIQEAADILNR